MNQSALMTLPKHTAYPPPLFIDEYRNLDAGLLAVVKSGRTSDGKWYDLYRSLFSRVDLHFDEGNVRVEVVLNEHVADKFTRIWSSMPGISV